MTQTGSGSCRGYLRISSVDGRLVWSTLLAQNQIYETHERHLVVNAGEVLRVQATDITGTITFSTQVHGYELDAP